MEYQYEYLDLDTKTEYDFIQKRNVTKTDFVLKKNWVTDKSHQNLTGEVRVCHYMYQACKMRKNKKRKMVLEKSDYVDDILEIKEESPYTEEYYYQIFHFDPEKIMQKEKLEQRNSHHKYFAVKFGKYSCTFLFFVL